MNTLITIGRQFGSGGREIGEKVAAHYGIPYYDKELITKAAANSGFCKEMIQQHDEAPTNSFLYNLVMDTYSFGYNASNFVDMPISQKVFLAQFDTIKQLAKEGPAVFIGRCADSALQDFPNVINLFIYADDSYRIHEIMHRYPDITTEQKARDFMNKKDRQRQSYYNYYSSKKWGEAKSYDLCIDSGEIGIDGAVELIIKFIELKEKLAASGGTAI